MRETSECEVAVDFIRYIVYVVLSMYTLPTTMDLPGKSATTYSAPNKPYSFDIIPSSKILPSKHPNPY